jgi:RNA methyltransferase, TrmH family
MNFEKDFPPLKWIQKIRTGREGLELKYCLVEGWKCVEEVPEGVSRRVLLHDAESEERALALGMEIPTYLVPGHDLRRCCSTQNPEGVLLVVDRPEIEESLPRKNGLVLSLFQWRDPSNIGALVRTARGLGVSAVGLIGSGPDFFHPKVIRSSMGSVFHLPLFRAENNPSLYPESKTFLAAAGGTDSRSIESWDGVRYLIIGSESHGLPEPWLENGQVIGIDLKGGLESLSAPVAGALLADHFLQARLDQN